MHEWHPACFNERAAAGIDKHNARFHQPQGVGIYEVFGLVGKRTMQRNNIALRQ